MPVPIIDLFAGPGGLGEGFSQVGWRKGDPFYKIGLSVEMEENAHRTLKLRSFLRQFSSYDKIPEEYFEFLKNDKDPEELYKLGKYKKEADAADKEARQYELSDDQELWKKLGHEIKDALKGRKDWVLIGGPPCQAYSNAMKARSKGIKDYDPKKDKRFYLYQHYLRIISEHRPAVFVMENVKGLLSSTLGGKAVFGKIMRDLSNPYGQDDCKYRIFSLVKPPESYEDPTFKGKDFVIKAEEYGIPQARHRVILLGVREDICLEGIRPDILKRADKKDAVKVKDILQFPKLRSAISRDVHHTNEDWENAVKSFPLDALKDEICKLAKGEDVFKKIASALKKVKTPRQGLGKNFVKEKQKGIKKSDTLASWYEDDRIQGIYNFSSRGHMKEDLHRYMYVSCFADVHKRSPKMKEIPEPLHPKHKNKDSGHFNVRFRVQPSEKWAHTVTSHISKDGHDNIHFDPEQCRSLTVREAARLQTFPDNYFFCGERTAQFVQVGNAVPPLLANKIAHIVKKLLKEAFGHRD